MIRERALSYNRGRDGISGAREDREQAVALCPHLAPSVATYRAQHDLPLYIEHFGVAVAQRLEKAR
jgi:hypothetical protein